MDFNRSIIDHIWRNYPDKISVDDIAAIFNAKQWRDVSAIVHTNAIPEQSSIELDMSTKILLSSMAVELTIENQMQGERLINLQRLLAKKGDYQYGSEEFKAAQRDVIDALQTMGLAPEVGGYFIDEGLMLQARADEFEYSVFKQAQSLLLKQIQAHALTEAQVQYLMRDKYHGKEFKLLFPSIDQALINFLDVDKKYHLLELQHIQLASSDIQNYAKAVYQQRVEIKSEIREAINRLPIDEALLTLFAECRSINENDQLSIEHKSLEIIKALPILSLRANAKGLSEVLATDPWLINKEILYKASKQINTMIMARLTSDEDIDEEYLEKIVTTERTGSFSEELLGFSMTEKMSLTIDHEVQSLAATKLLHAKLSNNTSATFLAKLTNEPHESMIRQLCASEKCSDAIIKNRLINRFEGNTLVANITSKTKSLINQEVLSMTLSCSQIKKIIDYNQSYPKNTRDLFSIVDENILNSIGNGLLFSEALIAQLTERLQAQEKFILSISQKMADENDITMVHDLFDTFSVDDFELSSTATDEINNLKQSLVLIQEKIHVAVENVAAKNAEESLKNMPKIHKVDVERRVKNGGDRNTIMDEYRHFYHQKAKGVLEKYVNNSKVNLFDSNFLTDVTEIKVLLTEVDAINQKIKECRSLDIEKYIQKAKHTLAELLPSSEKEVIAFVDDDVLKQLALHAKQTLRSKIECTIKQKLNDGYLDKEQLTLIFRNKEKDINVYIMAFPEIDPEVLRLSTMFGKVFDEQCQMIAADFLDQKSEFEMQVISFLENNPDLQDLSKFFELTDIALDGVLQINQLSQFLQEKVGCSEASVTKFIMPMSQWLNQQAKMYLKEDVGSENSASSMTRILAKLNLGGSQDATYNETISTIDLDEDIPVENFVSFEEKKTKHESPISVQSDATDNEELSETELSPTIHNMR